MPTHSRAVMQSAAKTGNAGRIALLLGSFLIAAALVAAAGVKPANAGHKWIAPAIAGAVIGGIIAHQAHRHYHHHGKYHYRYPKRHVRYHRPHYPRRYYGAPYVAFHGPGFGLYIGR